MKSGLAIIFFGLAAILFSGCSSIPMASIEKDAAAKNFSVAKDKSRIYVYRNELMGAAIGFDVIFNGKLAGKTKAKTFFVFDSEPGAQTIMSRAENDDEFKLTTEAGKIYYIWQEAKMGFLYARNKLNLVSEAEGQAGVKECKMIEQTP